MDSSQKSEMDTHTNPQPDPQPAKSKIKAIGHYFLGKTIGEGTFGKVKLGTHTLTGEKVAVKILEKERISDVADVERVAREIHILKLIRHPNIIQLYEIIETPKQLYLIMEFASGGEVFDYIVAHTRVKEKEACRFFQQIISGIEYISRLGIVHRDLKPENLLLDHDKNIKIVDFGLSNTYKSGELLKTACGSPCYAAPEMIAGKKYLGAKVDIWSCGVILFALVCGYLPFEDPNTSELYKKILSGDYQCPKFISDDCKDLISRILTTDPDNRYTIEQIRAHPWYRLVKQDIAEGILVGYNQILLDKHITAQIEKYGLNIDHARSCLEANKHNHVTTTYYLLLKKKLQEGGVMEIDDRNSGDGQDKAQEAEPETGSNHPPVPKLSLDLSLFPIIAPRRRRVHSTVQAKRTASTADASLKERSLGSHRLNVSHDSGRVQTPGMHTKAVSAHMASARHRTPRQGHASSVSPIQQRGRQTRKVDLSSILKEGIKVTPTPRPPSKSPVHNGMGARSMRVKTKLAQMAPQADTSLEYGSANVTRLSPKTALVSENLNTSLPLNDSIRKAKGAFSISCTSSRDPEDLLEEVMSALNHARVSFKSVMSMQVQDFTLRCQKNSVQFEVEIATLEGAAGLYAVKFKRVAGDMRNYKELCTALLNNLSL